MKYILKKELIDTDFGKATVYNVYLKIKNEETLDSTFGIKEKAEKYALAMNEIL